MLQNRILLETAALTGSSVMARSGVPAWDTKGFQRINALPDALAPLLWGPMQAGALGAPLVVGAALLGRGRTREAVRTATTGAAAWGLAKVVKKAVGRGRPGDHIEGTILRLGSADNGLGFPSGHAAVAISMVAAITTGRHAGWRVAGFSLAAVVGASRIYVGAHYPLDVVGGYALGALIADCYRTIELVAMGD